MTSADRLYDRLIRPIETRMMGTVARIVGDPDEAADVFQEVLAVVWKRLARIDRHANPQGYILRICITRSYDALRKRARRRRREIPLEAVGEGKAPAVGGGSPSGRETAAAIREAVGRLPAQQARAVLLRAVDGASYEAIGSILGCRAATARSHVAKGRARLRETLTRLGILEMPGETT